MIASAEDVRVLTRSDYERLPEGRWEVAEGRAILAPPPEYDHQLLSDELIMAFNAALKPSHLGRAVTAVAVFIPPSRPALGEVQSRIPDICVSRGRPVRAFEVGSPPDLVIEILSTRGGNVERSEKLDDYALASIREYWIADPFRRAVEVYMLRGGEYALAETARDVLQPQGFPGVEIQLDEIWAVLD